eukprot:CAMPEP_0204876000 /NCGR_PEP_ID=MMETSP1348-20121228/47392_1 /ASSEMBLY_ACC=CAM_ASM_000700 /TAXON_ID=215587 /ORGANISM="Aplanochytrium stocchinoi, Strain GSBS06" /LENGTH=635 /DNA_ID=CAMNT_0052032707 /DNA_START=208 /DNA_END=2112 /DNA_ORIENTATION=-
MDYVKASISSLKSLIGLEEESVGNNSSGPGINNMASSFADEQLATDVDDVETRTTDSDVLGNKIVLAINNLTYEVGEKDKKKDILNNVSASYTSCELVAVMGPSGAGKTTYLNVLSNSRSNKQIRTGGLTLNGEALPKGYNSLCSYIPQNDVLYPALSPRQSFQYATQLRLPSSTPQSEKDRVVEKLLSDLHLHKCADTPVGSETQRGVSGGEKKRTSIGLELIVNPAIILVDEPTSGLDSKMAEDVVEMLQVIAQKRGRLVLCTIHQPSWKVFERFDKLTLLNHGHIVYHGAAPLVIDYFNALSFKVPSFENPMDFYFRELQTKDEKIFRDAWAKLNATARMEYETDSGKVSMAEYITGAELVKGWSSNANSGLHQFVYLFLRTAQDTLRDKEKFIQGLVMKLAIGVLLGVIFYGQADGSSESVFTAQSALFFIVLSSTMDTTMKALLEYPQIKPLVVREYRNGAFRIFPYFMAQLVSNSIFDSLASLFYMPAYFMVGLSTDANKIFYFLGILFFLTVLGVEIGLLIGSNTADIKEAQGYFIPIIMPQLLFAGFLIPPDQIPVYFKWIYQSSFFQYALSGAIINEFEDYKFSDCVPVTDPATNCTTLPFPCVPTGEAFLDTLSLEPSYKGRNMW